MDDAIRTAGPSLHRSSDPRLPHVPGLQVASRYLPAGHDAQLGGDWYDVVEGPPSRHGATVVIGDVVGHGARAAGSMRQISAALRALLRGDVGPAVALARLDRMAASGGSRVVATAVVAAFEYLEPSVLTPRGRWTMTWSNAGHPPPIVIGPLGAATLAAAWRAELLLGVGDGNGRRSEHRLELLVGSTVVFYTDGLVERRHTDIDAGIRALTASLSGVASAPVTTVVETALKHQDTRTRHDDIAVLAVRLGQPTDRFAGATFSPTRAAGLLRGRSAER